MSRAVIRRDRPAICHASKMKSHSLRPGHAPFYCAICYRQVRSLFIICVTLEYDEKSR